MPSAARNLARVLAVCLCVACAPAAAQRVGPPPEPYARDLSAAPADEAGRAWFRAKVERCFARLEVVLDAEGYTHDVALEWRLGSPSVVDAVRARSEASGRDVTLLTDGNRIHVHAPFVSYQRARALQLQTRTMTSDAYARVCIYVRTIELDAQLRRAQRQTLALISLTGFGAAAAIVFGWRRRRAAPPALPAG